MIVSSCAPPASTASRGIARMQALVAVMRKPRRAMFGMFRHQQRFDGAKLYRAPGEIPLPQPAVSTVKAE